MRFIHPYWPFRQFSLGKLPRNCTYSFTRTDVSIGTISAWRVSDSSRLLFEQWLESIEVLSIFKLIFSRSVKTRVYIEIFRFIQM